LKFISRTSSHRYRTSIDGKKQPICAHVVLLILFGFQERRIAFFWGCGWQGIGGGWRFLFHENREIVFFHSATT